MARILERPRARQELERIALEIGKERLSSARRFLREVKKTYELLASFPEMGTAWESEDVVFNQVRFFPVRRFRKYLIFYRPIRDGVEIVLIIHGSRDIEVILKP